MEEIEKEKEVSLEKPVEERIEEKVVESAETEQNNLRRNVEKVSSEEKQKNKKNLVLIIVLAVILLGIIAFFVVNKLNTTKVYNNVYLQEKNISSYSKSEVNKYLEDMSNSIAKRQIHILNGEEEIGILTAEDIKFTVDVDETTSTVMNFGRDKGILVDGFNIAKAMFSKKTIDVKYTYSTAELKSFVLQILAEIDGAVVNDSYTIDEETHSLIITRGKSGKGIDEITFEKDILALLKVTNETDSMYKLNFEDKKPTALDVDVIYSEVKRDPVDASVDETGEKPVFINHVIGLDFNKEELKAVLAKEENIGEGKVIKFALKTTEPKVKLKDIKKDLYDDVIASYKTYFLTVDSNRVNNLRLGLKSLEGTIVMPGETFSFTKTLGDCSSARGYLPASTFIGGKSVREVGGGICQIASTLYNTVLYANLEVVLRYNHSLPVSYVPVGRDATVYYPSKDFKFKNTREYPIKIVTEFNSGGSMTITFMGTKQDVEYEVVLTSWKTSTIPSTVTYKDNQNLAVGKTKTTLQGTNGYTSVAYKEVKLNGVSQGRVLLSSDRYNPTPTTIERGTKAATPVVTPTPTPTPTTPETPTPTPTPATPATP